MNQKPILFNKPQDGNFWLTNFQTGYPINSGLPTKIDPEGKIAPDSDFIKIDGSTTFLFPTAEHLFQALKYTQDNMDTDLIKKIIKSSTPDEARRIGQKIGRKDWIGPQNYRLYAMRFVLRRKYGLMSGKYLENPLGEKLLKTGDSLLIENSGGRDKFWGNGEDKNGINGTVDKTKGENQLGELSMELRALIKRIKLLSQPTPPSPNITKPQNDSSTNINTANISDSTSSNPSVKPSVELDPKEEKENLSNTDISTSLKNSYKNQKETLNQKISEQKRKINYLGLVCLFAIITALIVLFYWWKGNRKKSLE
jgi:ribA/ribD-fused uncharacterized protein